VVAVGLPVAFLGWRGVIGQLTTASAVAAHRARGDEALAAGRFGEALAAYERARELEPADPGHQRALMWARVSLAAAEPGRIPPEQADSIRYEASVLATTDPALAATAWTAEGNLLLRAGERGAARGKLEEAVQADPGSVVARTGLGVWHGLSKDGAQAAKAELEAALRADPAHAPALVALAQFALKGQDLARAVELLDNVLDRREGDVEARLLLAEAKLQLGSHEEAVALLERTLELDPRNVLALRKLGQAFLGANKPERAEAPLRAAAEAQADPTTLTGLGASLSRQGKHEEAADVFRRVLEREPWLPAALFGAASSLEALGKRDEAIPLYQRLVSLDVPPEQEKGEVGALRSEARRRLASPEKPPELSPGG
jgi:tetratricopeptide (TPR) repeat protein